MWSAGLWMMLATGCVFGPVSGAARIQSSRDAPWKPGRVLAYWIQTTSEGSGETADSGGGSGSYGRASGYGTLFLVDSDRLDCDTLLSRRWPEGDWGVLGDGLILTLGYERYVDDAEDAEAPGFPGLYLSGASYSHSSGTSSYRAMDVYAIYDGYLSAVSFYSFALDPSWARVDVADDEQVKGEFFTDTWEGRFNALNCGEVEQGSW